MIYIVWHWWGMAVQINWQSAWLMDGSGGGGGGCHRLCSEQARFVMTLHKRVGHISNLDLSDCQHICLPICTRISFYLFETHLGQVMLLIKSNYHFDRVCLFHTTTITIIMKFFILQQSWLWYLFEDYGVLFEQTQCHKRNLTK